MFYKFMSFRINEFVKNKDTILFDFYNACIIKH